MISEGLKRAVAEHDIVAARSSFYTIILSDPMFQTNKFDEALEYVKRHPFEGFMDPHDGEELIGEAQWDEAYFDLLASKLQDNFSEERILQLKRVAKGLRDRGLTPKPQVKSAPEHKTAAEGKTRAAASETKTKRAKQGEKRSSGRSFASKDFSWLWAVGGVVAAGLVLRKLLKGERK